ncbi:uncharacterized protein LOC143897569 isoform X2 [Temnothorax americanus]|uniref:uncharacterized protein LOC143897569 isoform X2 n=1 Tax=Temnothorax americanus TaxID=1964332 RepID=UPI004067666D
MQSELDPFPSPPQTINSKNPYKTKKEKAVLIQNNNQHLAVNDTTLQITNDVPDESACTPQNVSAKKRNKNSNNSSTVGQHIYSYAVENEAKNAITELTLDTDNNIIFDFPELEQQENASALIDPLVSRHTSNDLSFNAYQRFVVRTLTNINFDMKNVQRELNAMKESIAALNRKEDNELDEKENVLINLPLKTIDGDLRELEENLTNKEFRSQVIKELQQTGGKTIKNMSIQIMRKLFSDELAEQFSWVGGKKKEVFSDLRICKAILYVIGKRFTGTTEDDIAAPIKTWLAHAKERAHRAKKTKKKKLKTRFFC